MKWALHLVGYLIKNCDYISEFKRKLSIFLLLFGSSHPQVLSFFFRFFFFYLLNFTLANESISIFSTKIHISPYNVCFIYVRHFFFSSFPNTIFSSKCINLWTRVLCTFLVKFKSPYQFQRSYLWCADADIFHKFAGSL